MGKNNPEQPFKLPETDRTVEVLPQQVGVLAHAFDLQTNLTLGGEIRAKEGETLIELTLRQWLATLAKKNAFPYLGPATAGFFGCRAQSLDATCQQKIVRVNGMFNRGIALISGDPLETVQNLGSKIPEAKWKYNDLFYVLRIPVVDENVQEALIIGGMMEEKIGTAYWQILNTLATPQHFTELMHLLLGQPSWGGKDSPATSTNAITLPPRIAQLQLANCREYRVCPELSKIGHPPSSPKGLGR